MFIEAWLTIFRDGTLVSPVLLLVLAGLSRDPGVLGGIQATPQFLDAIGNPTGAFVSQDG